MAQTAETVITAMQMDVANYVAGANTVIQTNARLIASANQLRAVYANLLGGIGGGGGGGMLVPGGGGGGGTSQSPATAVQAGGGIASLGAVYLMIRGLRELEQVTLRAGRSFLELSKSALQEYASFDTLQLSFEGMYGSAAKANQMMTYLRDTAMTSAFHFRDLADAARSISVVGLDVNKWLPITQGFALAMGHIDSAGLQDFIGILRRIQGGNLGVALGPRGIGRYGIGREELEAHGGTFDGGGHFTGSINQAFDTIEKVFTTRIKAIGDKVTASTEVALSNWGDAIQQAEIDFGAGMKDQIIEPLKRVTSVLNTLRQSGIVKDFGETLWSIITGGGTASGSDVKITGFKNRDEMDAYDQQRFGIQDIKATWASGKSRVPTTTGDPMADTLIHIGGAIVQMVYYAKLIATGAVTIIPEILGAILGAVIGAADVGVATAASLLGRTLIGGVVGADAAHLITGGIGNLGDPDSPGEAWQQDAFNDYYGNVRRRQLHPEAFGSPAAPPGTGIPGAHDDSSPNGNLKAIREHTRQISQKLDMRATAFGGGDLGRLGVTQVERSGLSMPHGTGGSISETMMSLGGWLERRIDRMIQEAQAGALRQGYMASSIR